MSTGFDHQIRFDIPLNFARRFSIPFVLAAEGLFRGLKQ